MYIYLYVYIYIRIGMSTRRVGRRLSYIIQHQFAKLVRQNHTGDNIRANGTSQKWTPP